MLPLPNRTDRSETNGQYNFVRQETSRNPRWNNVVRLDWKPTDSTSYFATVRTFNSNQYGSEITVGPAKWGFFNAAYLFSDSGVSIGQTHIFTSGAVNELQGGVKHQTEGFQTASDADWQRITRSASGFNLGQFHPELNTIHVIPRATFGVTNSPDFTYDQRLGETDPDWVLSARDNFTWVRHRHTLKAGGYVELIENNEARTGNWMGEFRFNRDTTSPIDTNFAFSNALLGVFSQYTESDAYRNTFNRGILAEWFAQDTWRASNRLTVDYGLRVLWYSPWWRPDRRGSNFIPALYDPAKAPRLYQPAVVDGKRVGFDAVTGQIVEEFLVGSFVKGTGSPTNGLVLGTDPGVPKGFRDQLPPQLEPRAGFAYDLFGRGKTALHVSAGQFHNARLGSGTAAGNNAGNPPLVHTPTIFNGTMSTLLQMEPSGVERPSSVSGYEQHVKTPSSYNLSAGIQQDLGWGTVVDVTYVGTLGRHLDMTRNINAVPDGARFLDLHPENIDPRTGRVLPTDFLRPYRGYGDINLRGHFGTSKYNALQVQLNRRYIKGLQFSAAYTFANAYGVGDDDPSTVSIYRPLSFYYANATHNQNRRLVINYTWDVPKASRRWNNAVARGVLDGWQLSGENALVDGDWTGVDFSTTDAFDFTGGDGGTTSNVRPVLVGDPILPRGSRDVFTGWFNTAAFARPSGRGDYGNAPRTVVQKPGVNNWNLSAFKNVALGRNRKAQYRLEAYNVLNKLQMSDINNDAQFDPSGVLVNKEFGKATSARAPRILVMSLRFNF